MNCITKKIVKCMQGNCDEQQLYIGSDDKSVRF